MLSHHAGNVPRGEGEALAERRKCLINCMASVAAKAAEAGIVCCFHPNSAKNSLFRTEEDYEAMFELIQPTAIGWAPDVGHIENGGMSAIEQMKAHRDLIRHVHFKDRIAQNEWAVMGEGKIDYPAIIKYLAETGYLGWIMVEDESPRAETDSDGLLLRTENICAGRFTGKQSDRSRLCWKKRYFSKDTKKFFLRRKRDYEYAYSCGNGSRSPW